jgi:hypothetical protein
MTTHKGSGKSFGDILNRNPAGLEINEIQNLPKSITSSVNKTELKTGQAVLKNLKNLADKQRNDPKLQITRHQ